MYFYILVCIIEHVCLIPGKTCDISFLQAVDAFSDRHKEWGLDYLTEKVHLLTLKAN